MFENIAALSAIAGTSGDEGRVREYIYNEIKDLPGCSFSSDGAGNLLVAKKGGSPAKNRLIFTAHMDEVGFIITHITDSGFLRFTAIGGIDTRLMSGKRVLVGCGLIPGLMGSKAMHQASDDERKKAANIDELYIDIGADSKEAAEKLVRLGDRAVWDTDFTEFGDSRILGKALDDRAGCALLMELLKDEAAHDFTAAFTTREEVGGNGASSAAFGAEPDIAVVVESTTAGDVAGVPEEKWVCHQGGGPVVSFIDRGTVYDMDLYTTIMDWAQQEHIPAQTKHGRYGGNDAAHIHSSRDGVRPVAVSLPARYIHAPAASLLRSDVEDTAKLLRLLRDRLTEL